MATPQKDNATSSATTPGNGDAWGTMHAAPATENDKSDGSASAGSSDSKNETREADVNEEAKIDKGEDAGATDEELLDAVLEAEAAAIVDNAMDEVRAEAEAKVEKMEGEAAVETVQAQADEWKDKYMRLHAEWDTYRRRQKEQAETQKALAAEKLVSSLIPVIDDLERSINYAQENGEAGLLGGVEAVLAKFIDTLKKDGVEVIDPKGEAFEALEAQAVGTVEDASVPDETVADVYQKGYKIGMKVLRPAMVTITTGGPARPKEED